MKWFSGFMVIGVLVGIFLFMGMWCPNGVVSGCGAVPNMTSRGSELITLSGMLLVLAIGLPVAVAVFIAVHLSSSSGSSFDETLKLIKKYLSGNNRKE